jgi:hypothetical protein
MAGIVKFEQAVLVTGMVDMMRHNAMDGFHRGCIPWALVTDKNVNRIANGIDSIHVYLGGGSGASHKVSKQTTFVFDNVLHTVYTHTNLFPGLAVVVRQVPTEVLKLTLDTRIMSTQVIHVTFRGESGNVVFNTDFPTSDHVISVAAVKSAALRFLVGQGRSSYAPLEVYEQGNPVALRSAMLIWHFTWQLPRGRYVGVRRRITSKQAPAHPTMNYWVRRQRSRHA